MALLQTPALDTTMKASDFTLEGVDGKSYTYAGVAGPKGTLIMFICNHCPYVKSIAARLQAEMRFLQDAGIGVAAIMSNDTEAYPEDAPEKMKIFAQTHGFEFPYLIDDGQTVAKAYGAVCTPDFFGFDAGKNLVYRGRLDSAGHRPADLTTVPELREAMLEVAAGNTPPLEQFPSMGCSIKWRE